MGHEPLLNGYDAGDDSVEALQSFGGNQRRRGKGVSNFIMDNFGWVIGVCCFLLFMMFVAISHDIKEERRLLGQCMADGRKEYECRSMLQKPQTTVVPMPVVIHR